MGSRKVLHLNELVVKSGVGYLSGVDEAELMRFVKKNTSIPVTEVFCVHVIGNRYYIFMSNIEGNNTLDNKWPDLRTEEKGKIANQLHTFITEMRALPFPHGESLGSLASRRCKDICPSSFKGATPIPT